MEGGLRRKDALEGIGQMSFVGSITIKKSMDVLYKPLASSRQIFVPENCNDQIVVIADDVVILVEVAADKSS